MARSLEEGFETFISWLKPLKSEHEKVLSHKESVQNCLKNKHDCHRFFETGSFGAGTGVRHYSDTDYFAVCPASNLWNDSAFTLRKFKESLQDTFSRTFGIVVNSPAVRIPFGTVASEMMEVTPCCSKGLVKTEFGNYNIYHIPDGDGNWMDSSPGAFNAYVEHHNKRLNGRLKPLIQLVKAWKYYNDAPVSSFYLELRVTKYAETETTIVYDIDLYRIFKFLYDNDLPDINDPLGISGRIKACSSDSKYDVALNKVNNDFKRAESANQLRKSNLDECFRKWDIFFNYKFPSR